MKEDIIEVEEYQRLVNEYNKTVKEYQRLKNKRLFLSGVLIVLAGVLGYNIGIHKEKDEKTLIEGTLKNSLYCEVNGEPTIVKMIEQNNLYKDVILNMHYVTETYAKKLFSDSNVVIAEFENMTPVHQKIPAEYLYLPDNQESEKKLVKYLQEIKED